MDMAEAGEASGAAGQRSGEARHVIFMAATGQWERNRNGKRLRNESAEPVSAPGDWRSWMERTVRQQARDLTQLHQTIDSMMRMLEAHTAREEAQWCGMKAWLEDRETKWDNRHRDNVLWGAGIADITTKVLGKARVREPVLTQEGGKDERNETARPDSGGPGASQHASAVQGGEPEKRRLQQQTKPKPKLQLKQQPKQQQQHEPRPKPTPAPARRWETVQPCTQSQRAPTRPGPTLTFGSSKAERRQIPRRDEGVPLPSKMDQEIASAINRAPFHQKAPAHIRNMHMKRNPNGAITLDTHQNAMVAMALAYRKVIINAAHTVDKGVINVEQNKSWERLTVHAVPLVRYMGKGTEGLETMREEIHAENEGVVIPVQVRLLANPHSIRVRRQRGEISASSVVFVVKGDKVARRLIKEGIKAAGVWYQVEPFTDVGPYSRCERCRGWGHIESKCSSKLTCGYCSGPHPTSTHKCNVVGCIAKKGSLCGHTQEKCPNCNRNQIAFSSRCAKKAEATKEARQRRRRETAERTKKTVGPTSGANRTALGLRAWAPEGGERGGSNEEMADAQEEAAKAEDITVVESTTPTTTATPALSTAGTAMAAGTGSEPRNGTGAAAPNV